MSKARAISGKWFGRQNKQLAFAVGLGAILLLGAWLRFYKLGAYSIGNSYYAATVQSMLSSWHNFFFAAFEPGGSVTVDKPPLGLWIQAVSAYFLGVNGFALALPQALAGVLSIPLLYAMVKRQFGVWAGLAAALVLAVMPVTVSTERNNTMDGLLLFVLLLATWAFLRAVREGRLGYLYLGTFMIGLGFNIKMLQAFMPLPALYAVYWLGSALPWKKRLLHLSLATVLLVVVSLSWAVAVDLTPAEERPYIGSSSDNTVMELIIGHNGLKRLGLQGLLASTGTDAAGQNPGTTRAPQQNPPQRPGVPGNPPAPPGGFQPGQVPPGAPPQSPGGSGGPPPGGLGPGQVPQRPGDAGGVGNPPAQARGDGRNHEVGEAGLLRLFSEPLVTEAGWLLPLALLGIPLVLLVLGRPWPLRDEHLALLLWAGWLLPEMLYFSLTTGLFHAYYLIMLGPPLAALVGATVWALGRILQQRPWLGWALSALLAGITVAFQMVILRGYPDYALGIAVVAMLLVLGGLGLAAAWQRWPAWSRVAMILVLLGLVVAPLSWSTLTMLNENPNVALPRSGPDAGQGTAPDMEGFLSTSQQAILDYLLAHTISDGYLVATLNAREASPYILATLRPVLTFGGFSGGDNVIGVGQLSHMVADGELRFVLGSTQLDRQKPEIAAWLENACSVVSIPGVAGVQQQGQPTVLYDCGGYVAQGH